MENDPMNYIDTHFHLDLCTNPQELAQEIERANIYTIAVTNTPSVFDFTYQLSKDKKFLRAALGLHPELVHQRAAELPMFMDLISLTRYIGEIGLDFSSRNVSSKIDQIRIFEKIIDRCAIEGRKIITIHSRRAEKEVIEIIGNKFPGKVILHWYSGSIKALETAIDYGFYFSINYQMINSKNGQDIIRKIPNNKLLTESDGPFIEVDKDRSSPKNIQRTCLELDSMFNRKEGATKSIIYENFTNMLKSHSTF